MFQKIWARLSLIIIVILVLVLIGGGLYLKGKNSVLSHVTTSATPMASASSTPAGSSMPTASSTSQTAPKPTPSPTPSNVVNFGFRKGIYHPFKITLSPGWRATPGTNNTATEQGLIIDSTINGKYYSIVLSEDTSSGTGNCKYPNETPTPAPGDSIYLNYVPIYAGPITFRRGEQKANNPFQGVCQSQITGYAYPTEFGNIYYDVGTNPDEQIVTEMDDMLSTIRATE